MSRTFKIGDAITKTFGVLWGTKNGDPESGETVNVTDGHAHMMPPSERQAGLTIAKQADPSTTRISKTFATGLIWALLRYRAVEGATRTGGQRLKIVLNAASDDDANSKLSTEEAHLEINLGDDLPLTASVSDPITRIDFQAAQAETAGRTRFLIFGGTPT